MAKARRALALLSGGLDSLLAARLILDQGIDVEGINFFTGFCVEGHTHAIRKRKSDAPPKRNGALFSAHQLGIKCHIIDVVEDYKPVVLNPKHGYGANLNPCLDCKVFMVSKALAFMEANGFDFLITGEVIGQRPKSQLSKYAPLVARESGAHDLLLRPLCAKLLEPTKPEREGWVDRERLLGLSGRSRKPQISLATSFKFESWAQPAGGCCFLTDRNYSKRLTDLWTHQIERDYELDDLMLLKVGRHLRPQEHFKLIIGREAGENRYLEGYRKLFTVIRPIGEAGATSVVVGTLANEEDRLQALEIAARFTQVKEGASVEMSITVPGQEAELYTVMPLKEEAVEKAWYL